MTNSEAFLHTTDLPALIKAGLAHVQFETIHPFLDGNGRLGRLLIALLFCQEGLLNEPILYLSLYLKQHRHIYYRLLQEVRTLGAWETWLEFFLEGVSMAAQQATQTAWEINYLFEQDRALISTLGRIRFSCDQVLTYMQKLPQVTVVGVSKALGFTAPTARSALNRLVDIGILEEVSGKQRDKVYVYVKHLRILEAGTEPLPNL